MDGKYHGTNHVVYDIFVASGPGFGQTSESACDDIHSSSSRYVLLIAGCCDTVHAQFADSFILYLPITSGKVPTTGWAALLPTCFRRVREVRSTFSLL